MATACQALLAGRVRGRRRLRGGLDNRFSLGGLPRLGVAGLLRELREVLYQFERPFVLDSSAATETFGLQPTPMEEALATTLEWWTTRRKSAS